MVLLLCLTVLEPYLNPFEGCFKRQLSRWMNLWEEVFRAKTKKKAGNTCTQDKRVTGNETKRDYHHNNNDDRGDKDHSKANRTNSILGRMVGSGMRRWATRLVKHGL